jgi:hypothetical protein
VSRALEMSVPDVGLRQDVDGGLGAGLGVCDAVGFMASASTVNAAAVQLPAESAGGVTVASPVPAGNGSGAQAVSDHSVSSCIRNAHKQIRSLACAPRGPVAGLPLEPRNNASSTSSAAGTIIGESALLVLLKPRRKVRTLLLPPPRLLQLMKIKRKLVSAVIIKREP